MSESAFAPDRKVSRQEMAAFMNRYAEYKGKTYTSGDLTSFTDRDQIAAWAYEDMAKAVGAGLIGGKAHGRLDPRGTATRAETCLLYTSLGGQRGSRRCEHWSLNQSGNRRGRL